MKLMHASLYTTSRAYSLVEILLIIGVSMFLFMAGLQAAIGSSSQLSYINTTNKVLTMIRQARSLAISGKAQLDYTDFDQDGLNYLSSDQVTPAHYGIYFDSDEVILFADNHGVAGEGKEGVYDPAPTQSPVRFVQGYDIILERFAFPQDIQLAYLESSSAVIFYSPIFADIIFDPAPAGSEFLFGFDQQAGTIVRKGCFALHHIAGIPESTTCP